MEKTKEQKNRMTENCHAVLTTGRLRALLCEMLGVFFLEFFNTTSCINQLLLAGEKRMAGRTDFNFNALVDRAQFYLVTAGAFCLDLMILRMDVRFHCILGLQRIYSHNSELLFASCLVQVVKIYILPGLAFLTKEKFLKRLFCGQEMRCDQEISGSSKRKIPHWSWSAPSCRGEIPWRPPDSWTKAVCAVSTCGSDLPATEADLLFGYRISGY